MDPVTLNRIFHDHECCYYDRRLAIVHDRSSARRARREVEALLGRSLRETDRVLDVGCGTGWLAAGLRRAGPATVVGLDLSAGMLARARAAGAGPLLQADAGRLPFRDGAFDVVAARGVLHHLPDVARALSEWRRALRPGGAVVLSSEPTPAVDRDGGRLARLLLLAFRRPLSDEDQFWELASMAANLHVFRVDELAAVARAGGFSEVRLGSRGLLSTLVLVASYVLHARAPRLAGRLPWRHAEALGGFVDRLVVDRLLPAGRRHTVAGVLR